jgi:cation:H+ antiporter
MLLTISIFLGSIALLWGSSEIVVRNVAPIARRLGINELTVTILGVSVFSSLPELSVSAFAALQGKADISIGNIIGSNFVTLTFVTALCALIAPINMRREIRDRESSWMILSTVVILLLALDRTLSRIDGAILVGLYIPYAVSVIRDMAHEVVTATDGQGGGKRERLWIPVAFEAVAIAGVILGARFALSSGQVLAEALHMPDLVLGAIFFALGTSLPELAIAISATVKKKADITMGEIYSSNIFTALGILGICCLIQPLTLGSSAILEIDIPFLILAGVVIQIFITTGLILNRIEALIILALYGYFVAVHLQPGIIPWHF